jgi:hypothetical protein
VIVIAGVMLLAVAGVGIAIISAVAANHPDRAAMTVVLVAAGGAFSLFLLGVLGLVGVDAGGSIGHPPQADVPVSPQRLALGLSTAVVLVSVAVWLVRTGDWRRPEDNDEPPADR